MSIKIEFSNDSITDTERRALVAFLEATGGVRPVADVQHASFPLIERTTPISPVLTIMPPSPEIKVGMTITDSTTGRTGVIVATLADREIEQLSKDVADVQSAPAPASPAMPTDLAAIFFGGAPTGKSVWPFPAEPEQPAAPAPNVVYATGEIPAIEGRRVAVTLDKNNLPWDARIHASSKTVNADGTWRAKKMVDKAVIATVEAELRATMGAPCPGPDPSLAHMRTVAIPAPLPASPSATPAQPAAPVAPAAPSGNPDTDLPVFLKEATALINAGRATTADMIAAANSAGIPHPGALTQRPDLIATVRAAFMAKVTPVAVAV